jgi:hypothetical protein
MLSGNPMTSRKNAAAGLEAKIVDAASGDAGSADFVMLGEVAQAHALTTCVHKRDWRACRAALLPTNAYILVMIIIDTIGVE